MTIKIAQRLFPFFHIPGGLCLIPGSDWQVQVFPAKLKFRSLISGEEREFSLDIIGPVLDFTTSLNLEKLRVEVFGHTARGFMSYFISMEEAGIALFFDKEKRKELIPVIWKKGKTSCERLSLGVHKRLDWELVLRRCDLKEIFPVWFNLGKITPVTEKTEEGVAALLKECPKLDVVAHFTKLFLAGFKSLLVPRLCDDTYQGIVPFAEVKASPLVLLSEGSLFIRSLFFKEDHNVFSFLPFLAPEFHEGRFVQITTAQGDLINFEWSKKLLKKVEILPCQTREVSLHFQHILKSFRVKHSLREKGKRHSVSEPLLLEAKRALYLDRFEK